MADFTVHNEQTAPGQSRPTLAGAQRRLGFISTLTASVVNECHYCVAAHSTMALRHGVAPDTVAELRAGKPLDDPKLEAAHTFTHAVVANRGWVGTHQVDAFLAAGYTHRHILDVILGVGMKTLSNYTNHIAGTPLDPAWAAQEWTPAGH